MLNLIKIDHIYLNLNQIAGVIYGNELFGGEERVVAYVHLAGGDSEGSTILPLRGDHATRLQAWMDGVAAVL